MKFYIADAFTEILFGGNPAGIVILPEGADFPGDEICVKAAAELRYSETAFIQRVNSREFNIRYFTPAAEVALCGHATIGAFTALKHGGYIGPGTYINHTLSGDLEITVSENGVLMDMAEPVKCSEITAPDKLETLYGIMGLDYKALGGDEKGIPIGGRAFLPQIISTGLPDIIMPVPTAEALEAIAPDFPALAALSAEYGVVGVHAFTTACNDATCHVRNFAPLYEINEEAATGTANGALTYYGYINGFIKPGDSCKFIQGEKMQRPSVITGRLEKAGDAPGKALIIRVGGTGVILAEGEIRL